VEHYIYGLRDPLTKKIRYVGYTGKGLRRRLWEHISESQKHKDNPGCHRHKWILSLLRQGVEPTIEILETVTETSWEARERYWIKKLALNILVNSTEGGEGLVNPSSEVRKRISRKVSKLLRGNSYRTGIPHSEEDRKAISEGIRNSPIFKEAQRNKKRPRLTKALRYAYGSSFRGKHFSKEHREKIGRAVMGNKASTGLRWISRGSKVRYISKDAPLPRGWVYGRSDMKRRDTGGRFERAR
jgi:hypothetical protein